MINLIYENRGFLHTALIETDRENLIFTRKNISGESRRELKISDIKKISVDKQIFSYSLKIETDGKEPFTFGGLDKRAVEELKGSLGSLVEIRAAREHQSVTLKEARKETEKILGKAGKDPDARPFVSYLVNQAVQLDSSDIHITPRKDMALIQYRIDGLLQDGGSTGKEIFDKILATLKNRAKIPSYKKSIPLDGSFHFDEAGLQLDVRCATVPTIFGEKIVMRILNSRKTPLLLEDLGFSEKLLDPYKKLITSPQGCIILTGPAGSGKTTTIFASLIHIYNSYGGAVNIATLEDPAEYIIEEFQQTCINPPAGLTFATGMKSLLRLDPDIIMIGEIRDPETAQMAMRSALTGHLIFTTIHSRDSIGIFPRLMEMDIKPAMISSALTAVLYQRLIRKLCLNCRKEREVPEDLKRRAERYKVEMKSYYTSGGCDRCSGTGYSGRTGIFELLILDEEIRDMITGGFRHREIYDYCKGRGMKFLWEDALEKVGAGITDFPEVMRNCPGGVNI